MILPIRLYAIFSLIAFSKESIQGIRISQSLLLPDYLYHIFSGIVVGGFAHGFVKTFTCYKVVFFTSNHCINDFPFLSIATYHYNQLKIYD